jgi:hypothetical protein
MILSFEKFFENKTMGIHKVKLTNPLNGDAVEVVAKFDTGARFSSIDKEVARELGFDEDTINGDKKSDEVSGTATTKSANGEEERIFVDMNICHTGNEVVKTQVSITDRSHMEFPVLIGLKDMDQVK